MPYVSKIVEDLYELLLLRKEHEGYLGVPTGLDGLDEIMGNGLNRQQLTYLVGESGIGKSWLLTWIILQVASYMAENPDWRPSSAYVVGQESKRRLSSVRHKQAKPPLIVMWSLEMAEMAVMVRMTAQAAQLLDLPDLETHWMMRGEPCNPDLPDYEEHVAAWQTAVKYLKEEVGTHIYLLFGSPNVSALQAELRDLASLHDIVLVGIDYFRKMDEWTSDGSMADVQASKSVFLAETAQTYDCHVLCIFDVTREGEKLSRGKGRVSQEHMKGGTAAVYDADAVWTLNLPVGEKQLGIQALGRFNRVGEVELTIEKNRYGPIGTILFQIDRATGRVTYVGTTGGFVNGSTSDGKRRVSRRRGKRG